MDFIQFMLENGIIGFIEEPVRINSGRMSYHYVNWRSDSLVVIARAAWEVHTKAHSMGMPADCFYGVPEGATRIAVLATYQLAQQHGFDRALPMGRGKAKEHGNPKDKYFVGAPAGKVVVVEDVTTTSGSLLATIEQLKEAGADISGAISLTDRDELSDGKSVADQLGARGMQYATCSHVRDILPSAFEQLKPSEETKRKVMEYMEQYGVKP